MRENSRGFRPVRKRKAYRFKLPVPSIMSAMSATKTSKTSKKSPDFTEQESVAIINVVTVRYGCINSSNHTSKANQRRRAAWDEVTSEVNACGGFGWTVESVQKRWKDMKSKVRNKPRLGRQTGGGPPEPPAPFEEPILAVLMGSSTIDGIVGEGLGDTYTYDGECLGDTCGDSQEGASPVGDEDDPDGDEDVIVISPDVPAGQDNITVDIPATKSSVDSGFRQSVHKQSHKRRGDTLDSDEASGSHLTKKKKTAQRQHSSPEADLAWVEYLKSATQKNKMKCAVLKLQEKLLRRKLQMDDGKDDSVDEV